MSIFWAVFLGFIQGATEFLPISSSGHLSIFQNIFNLNPPGGNDLFFDVILHLGTLIAVIIAFWKDIADMARDLFSLIAGLASKKKTRPTPSVRMILLIIVATLPLALVVPFHGLIESLSSNLTFIGCALLLSGVLLFVSDRVRHGKKTEETTRLTDALCVGLMQAAATSPGLSRSGSTITMGMFCGFDRKFAVRFAFLMSIPAVLGANIFELKDAIASGTTNVGVGACVAGVLTSAVVGFFAIKLIEMLVKKGKFGAFAYYCWIVGGAVVIYSLV